MKQHHKTAGSPAHDHDHGHPGHDHAAHDHAGHGHDHGHHHHAHDHHRPAAAVAEPVGWSLLRASLAERLLVAAGFTALAWTLIGLALT